MPSLKSVLVSSLRVKLVARPPLLSNIASRSISVATRNATSLDRASKSTEPVPLPISFDIKTYNPRNPRPARDNDFTTLLNSITTSLTTASRPHLPTLHSLLRTYSSDPSHWLAYAHANAGKQYTRNLVCEVPGIFNLLLLVWTPGKASPVHDHADAHCLMKVLKGEIRETRFAAPTVLDVQGPLVQTSCLQYEMNKVSYMADQLGLHSIANPSPTEYAVSLHLYTPPNAAMRGCRVYDMDNSGSEHVMQGAYDSVKGKLSPPA